eukprot:6116-Alexandrium_andersonii.AAC.1
MTRLAKQKSTVCSFPSGRVVRALECRNPATRTMGGLALTAKSLMHIATIRCDRLHGYPEHLGPGRGTGQLLQGVAVA